MTYASGSAILAADYNTFVQGGSGGVNHAVANVNSIWGTGSGDVGWGQSGTLSTVSQGGSILASQWTALTSRLDTILKHQTGSGYTISNGPAIVPGAIITAVTNLPTSISTAYTNRMNLTNAYKRSDSTYSYSAGAWFHYVRHTITVTVSSGAHQPSARYFFNTGGTIQFTFGNSTNTGDGANWRTLGQQCGTLIFGGNSTTRTGSTGGEIPTTLTTTSGYWQTATPDFLSPTTVFQQSGQSGAADYYIKVTAEGSPSTSPTIKFVVEYRDTVSGGTRSGNLQTGVKIYSPPTDELGLDYGPFYLTNTWGTLTPSVAYSAS